MAFGIQDLEHDVQKFQQDIENAKAKYMDAYAEFINIATELENVAQKYESLQEDVKPVTRIYSEEREEDDKTLSNVTISMLYSSAAVEVTSALIYMGAELQLYLLRNNPATAQVLSALATQAGSRNAVRLTSGASRVSITSIAMRQTIANGAKTVAMVGAAAGAILGIVSIALVISDVRKRKEYLETQKAELQKNLEAFNGYIAEANDDTKKVVNAFMYYSDEFGIDVNGVFNADQDGFSGESGRQKFDEPETGIASQLRKATNGAIKRIGELNTSINLAGNSMNFFIKQGIEGAELVEQVAIFTGLPGELIQRLYVFKLREMGSDVEWAITLSGLSEDLVKELYARAYLDDGKTIEAVIDLSGLTEDRIRRVFASKLIDDELSVENPNEGLNIEGIAEQAGVSDETILEILVRKTAAALPDSSEK